MEAGERVNLSMPVEEHREPKRTTKGKAGPFSMYGPGACSTVATHLTLDRTGTPFSATVKLMHADSLRYEHAHQTYCAHSLM